MDNATAPLRWGVKIMPDRPVAEVAKLGIAAERAGFDRCWLYDEGLHTRDLYVGMTAMALATERIHVGPGITNPYTRHASVTASAIASIYELSGGRCFLGLGAGGSLTLGPIDIQRDRPNTVLRESIQAIRALFDTDEASLEGSVVTLRKAHMDHGDPNIEIWIAGRGPGILATGAQLGDGISLDHIHEDFIADHLGNIRATAESVGNDLGIAYGATIVVTDADLELVRRHMTYRLVDSPAPVKAAIGLTERDTIALRNAMLDGLDAAAPLVKDDWILPFVIHGTEQECAARIVELAAAHDIDEFMVQITDHSRPFDAIERAEAIVTAARDHIA